VLVGAGAAARHDGAAVLASAGKTRAGYRRDQDGWNGFGVLHDTASRRRCARYGFFARAGRGAGGLSAAQMTTFGTLDVLFLLGADEIKVPDGTFVVYIGTHGDRGAIAPTSSCRVPPIPRNAGIYVNTKAGADGQPGRRSPPGEAREDWAIVRALSECAGQEAALRFAFRVAAGAVQGGAASDAHRPGSRPAMLMASRRSRPRAAASTKRRSRLLSRIFMLTNPIGGRRRSWRECSRLASGQI